MFTVRTIPGHPLSPRRRLPRAALVIMVLAVLWGIDPEYVDNIATWIGLVVLLLPAEPAAAPARDAEPAALSSALGVFWIQDDFCARVKGASDDHPVTYQD
ncbi:hypothetical protein ACFWS1_30005, partial [Streptomyces sp. NPDC058612]